MAMAPIVDDPGNPPGLDIVPLSADTVEDMIAVSAAGNEMSPEYASAFLPASVLEAEEVAAFLARVDGEPVATSMLVLTDDVAGVYAVSTVLAHRKKGYGDAVSRAAVREGRARGATVSILQSSAMGRPIHERMGFEMIGRYRVIQPSG
jgi:GNAT superfamily N-acetyltransferase